MLEKHYTKRDSILESALILFKDQGFNRVGVDLIIEVSEVAKMTFYKYFPSKMSLIEACLKEESQQIQESILLMLDHHQTSRLAKIKTLYDWHIENKGCLFARVTYEIISTPSILYIIKQHKKWKYNLIQQQLRCLNIKNEQLSDFIYTIFESLLIPTESLIDHIAMWKIIENILENEL